MGCRLACEARYVARKCGCRMMHMPGKELVGAEAGVQVPRRGLGAAPEAVSSPTTPGGAPVCSPQQYKDCADPALGKGQTSPASPSPLGSGSRTRRPGGPDSGDCGGP